MLLQSVRVLYIYRNDNPLTPHISDEGARSKVLAFRGAQCRSTFTIPLFILLCGSYRIELFIQAIVYIYRQTTHYLDLDPS